MVKMLYLGVKDSAQYCRMLIRTRVAFCKIYLISILIGSNHKIANIFLSKQDKDFILVSIPMFSTLNNSTNTMSDPNTLLTA